VCMHVCECVCVGVCVCSRSKRSEGEYNLYSGNTSMIECLIPIVRPIRTFTYVPCQESTKSRSLYLSQPSLKKYRCSQLKNVHVQSLEQVKVVKY
jgi:hypothetical protein